MAKYRCFFGGGGGSGSKGKNLVVFLVKIMTFVRGYISVAVVVVKIKIFL